MISMESEGTWKRTRSWLKRASSDDIYKSLQNHAQIGVDALASATPKDSGDTARLWDFEIVRSGRSYEIHWVNRNVNRGTNIAIILQTGHGTGTGGYVQGIDYINPSIRPVFDEIAENVWKEVTR